LVQTTGGVIPAQALTMNGGSVVTFAGANSLTGLTFNNNGGAAPTLNPTGVLTLTGGITSNPTNPGTVSIISNGTLDLNGAGSYSINVAATLINSVDVAPWQAGLIINSAIQNGAIVKTGAGVLQLGGASTFAGGLTVNAGGLIIATDTNSLILNDPVTTGPVGTGTLTMAANTTMLAGGAARTITNNVTFLGDSVFNGTNNLTLNGITTLPSVWNATVTAPQMTVTIGDASPSLGTDVINKSGLGILTVGNYAGTINASGGLLFSDDGNTLGTPENVSLGGNLVITGDTAITVNRTGSGPNSRNKTLQKVDLTVPGNIMSVSNQSGYGLEFTGNTLMTRSFAFCGRYRHRLQCCSRPHPFGSSR
jgi:autotransporter-associated beta strand protein